MTRAESENRSEFQEDLLKWAIRYVLIPVTVAALAGVFALAVVDRQFEHQNKSSDEDTINKIFATMTAAAATAQSRSSQEPTIIATAVPNQTEDASQGGTKTSQTVSDTSTPVPPQVCPQVPFGWQLYTVQPGNTLFSLARETGTTVATIRQVNCLYGELLAYSQIWLPDVFVGRPDPTVETTRIVEPVETLTPTVTVTEPTPLPDIALDTRDGLFFVGCVEACFPSLGFAVTNNGTVSTGTFNIHIDFYSDPFAGFDQFVAGLEPGELQTFSLTSEEMSACYHQGCQICVTVDSFNEVAEESEANNEYCHVELGNGYNSLKESDQ